MRRSASRSSKTHDDLPAAAKDPVVEKFIRFCESDFGKRVMNLEADYLRKELAGCGKILDIGCGIGSIEERLPDLDITGLESSGKMIEEARRRSDKTFIRGDAYSMPFPDSSFDGAFFVTALEFLENYRLAVVEAARVLKKGGRIVVMMLNPESEYFKAHLQKPGDYFRNIKHAGYEQIEERMSRFFELGSEYFLGINGEETFETQDKKWASLYVLKGIRE
ncbi:MAG: class I SAM-dependent methyltransferase [Candidatus Micrarchaeota archaeon]